MGLTTALHICGLTSKIIEMMAETNADVVSIDSLVNLFEARSVIGNRVGIMGNVSATLLVEGTEGDVARSVQSCIEAAGPSGGFILSTKL